jgi:hypothetical protein
VVHGHSRAGRVSHAVIFPRNDVMTTITSGGRPPGDMGPPSWTLMGLNNRLTAPYFPSLYYSGAYDAELAVKTIVETKDRRVGLVNKAQLTGVSRLRGAGRREFSNLMGAPRGSTFRH